MTEQHIKCMSSIKMMELWEFTKQKSSMFHVILHVETDNPKVDDKDRKVMHIS